MYKRKRMKKGLTRRRMCYGGPLKNIDFNKS